MIEDYATRTSAAQLVEPFPRLDFTDPLVFSCAVIAAILALLIVLYFYRFYKLYKLTYMHGIIASFSIISFAQLMLAVNVWIGFDSEISNLLGWFKILSYSYGFSFLALSYYYKNREEESTPLLLRIGVLSVIPMMIMLALAVFATSAFDLLPHYKLEAYFRMFNLLMLGYVFKSTLSSIVEQGRKEFMYIPAAYALLWLGQYSALIYDLDGNLSNFIAYNITKVIGLALFVGVLYQVRRMTRLAKKRA